VWSPGSIPDVISLETLLLSWAPAGIGKGEHGDLPLQTFMDWR
jgi:hypothetical protein